MGRLGISLSGVRGIAGRCFGTAGISSYYHDTQGLQSCVDWNERVESWFGSSFALAAVETSAWTTPTLWQFMYSQIKL